MHHRNRYFAMFAFLLLFGLLSGTQRAMTQEFPIRELERHPCSWRAMQLMDEVTLFVWCLEELEEIGLLSEADLLDYRVNSRNSHPRAAKSEGGRVLQAQLCASGFVVEEDGFIGDNTIRALQAFQKSKGISVTQFPDTNTLRVLDIDSNEFWSMSVSKDLLEFFRRRIDHTAPDS